MSTTTLTGINFVYAELHTIIRGHSYGPIKFEVKRNGIAVDLTSANIDCWFRRGYSSGKIVREIDESSGITITDATNGKFQIDKYSYDWTGGTYYYDIRFLLNNGDIKKYIYGEITIKEDSTNE
jgi:hypothetical protein